MIVGLGIDMVELARIKASLQRFGERFLHRVLTEGEYQSLPSVPEQQVSYVASRFAAKEAAVKALGTGFSQGIGLHQVEVLNLPSGQPRLLLHAAALRQAEALRAHTFFLSLSHERRNAVAVVVLEAE